MVLTTGKKYYRKKGTVVWLAIFLAGSNYNQKKLRPEKKGKVVWPIVEINLRLTATATCSHCLSFVQTSQYWLRCWGSFFFGGGKGAFRPKKGCNAPSAGYGFLRKKISASSILIVSYCNYDVYFNKYDMYSIVGIDKKTYGVGIGITCIYT